MKKSFSVILVLLWLFVIFKMSSFSAAESLKQSNILVDIIKDIFNINTGNMIDIINFIIRKLAHFGEYFILGILMYNMINNFYKKPYVAIIICILYAFSDEIHQIFVPGREFKILDICIDTFGSMIGVLLYKYIMVKLMKVGELNEGLRKKN